MENASSSYMYNVGERGELGTSSIFFSSRSESFNQVNCDCLLDLQASPSPANWPATSSRAAELTGCMHM
jgi:pantoate kinase